VVRFANNKTLIEMTESIDLPPEIEQVAHLAGRQRPGVREMFRYALMLAMIDDGKARITGTRIEADHEYLTDQTIAGDGCEIERPPIDEELESEPMRGIRHIVAEEGGEDGT
jgi:hypothetical protein